MSVLPEIDLNIIKAELTDFIKNITIKSKLNNVILGLSGGIDSTLVAYILNGSLANENIYTYHLYSSTTPNKDRKHAKLISKKLNLNYLEIPIDNILSKYLYEFDNVLDTNIIDDNNAKLSLANLNARVRMSILYYFANLKNGLVSGTGNRSELLIGYLTKFGDGACDFELIGDIYKTQVKELAKDLEIPKVIINKAPRAGLWDNQADEDEIGMTYDILDQLLYLIVDKKLENKDILKQINISKIEINRIRNMVKNSMHKIQSPPTPFKNKKLF
ncbi:MAG: NAD+ synthase [Methanobrevibacter sp.]|jgi:NAD+ synthase|nr:NAD+ synthase [Methanobrevibacter sp.]